MIPEEFIAIIRNEVWKSSLSSSKKLLSKPTGRAPSKDLLEMSKWHNSLDEKNQEVLTKVIDESARIAVFGFLCVLDGVREIEAEDKGELKLYYEKNGDRILLNDQNQNSLHEML